MKLGILAVLLLQGCVSAKWKKEDIACKTYIYQEVNPALKFCLDKFQHDELRIKTCDAAVEQLMKAKSK